MANRIGRPRTQISDGEIFATFARSDRSRRELLLNVLLGIDEGLRAAEEPFSSREDEDGGATSPVPGDMPNLGGGGRKPGNGKEVRE